MAANAALLEDGTGLRPCSWLAWPELGSERSNLRRSGSAGDAEDAQEDPNKEG